VVVAVITELIAAEITVVSGCCRNREDNCG